MSTRSSGREGRAANQPEIRSAIAFVSA